MTLFGRVKQELAIPAPKPVTCTSCSRPGQVAIFPLFRLLDDGTRESYGGVYQCSHCGETFCHTPEGTHRWWKDRPAPEKGEPEKVAPRGRKGAIVGGDDDMPWNRRMP